MNPADIPRYLDAALALHGYQLSEATRDEVLRQFTLGATIATGFLDLPLGPETTGVMCVRGSVVIKGYINRPEATADSIVDGWLNTGDIARIDEDGWVFIVDRAKDMVIRGGENVYCSEVEAAIYHHEAVAEAIVFGVPADRLGEAVAAVVVPVEGATITAEELTAFLKTDLSAYKIPSQIWVRTDLLPRNASGKFLKREVRKEILGG